MKIAFTSGTILRAKDGAIVRVSDRKKSWDWRVPGYLGDGFYSVDVITPVSLAGKAVAYHEDDLDLIQEAL